jgi:predicted nucleic acid-binding protein
VAVALFDTNILIDCLKGYQPAIDEVAYWDEAIISAITWMEVMSGTTDEDRGAIMEFLGNFKVVHTDQYIMDFAATLRKDSIQMKKKVALPDAIIMATALAHANLIITRNTRDFAILMALRPKFVRIPYEVTNTIPVGFINVVPPSGQPPLPRSFESKREPES